jgi:hypothetical protein
MKNFFSLTFLSFAALFLFSCEKEVVEPTISEELYLDGRAANCSNFSYFNKQSGLVQFGQARSEMLLIGFQAGMSLKARQTVLGKFPQFSTIDGEIPMDSGVITRIQLHPGSSCADIEKLLQRLKKESSVSFAFPFFGEDATTPEVVWQGLTNEFMVSIEGRGTYAQLKQVMALTRTKLVMSFDENIHVLSADKNSIGNIFEVLTIFNVHPAIAVAEPNVVYYYPSSDQVNQTASEKTAIALGVGSFKAFQKVNAGRK